jgi:antirestriction protein
MNDTRTERTETSATTITPRVYIASLSDYNAGWLLGRWIDAAQEPEAIHEEIRAMLGTSSEPVAEEWAVHDYEGFGLWSPGEYESVETLSAVARLIAEHGEVFGGS